MNRVKEAQTIFPQESVLTASLRLGVPAGERFFRKTRTGFLKWFSLIVQIAQIAALLSWAAPLFAEADEFCSVTGPCNLVFPRDHGAHSCYRTEWWYYTGNVETSSGKRYGFQLTFFRTRIVPPGDEKLWPQNPSEWRTGDLFFAHAALSDLDGKQFFMEEKMARGALGLAGVRQEDEFTRVFLGPWSAQIGADTHTLRATADDFSLHLTCRDMKGPVAHGLSGYSRKGKSRESSSCYYSFTRLETSGTLRVGGEEVPVLGTAWMDHEFSSAPLEKDVTGWDWFSIQLRDKTELMVYLLRPASGGYNSASSGTFVHSSGEKRHLVREDFMVEVLDRWKSSRSGALYPSRFRIRVPSLEMDLLVIPNLADQELVTAGTTQVTYWEGSVSVQGRSGPKPVDGVGYVELTGYAKPFQLLPAE